MLPLYYLVPAKGTGFKDKYEYTSVIDERSEDLSNTEKAWLTRATNLAKKSTQRHKHACIIVRGGSIQGFGINIGRNIPGIIQEIDDLAYHAEIKALKNTIRTDGAIAYIARVNSFGEQRMSKPCPNCMEALKNAGVKRVIYTINGSMYL